MAATIATVTIFRLTIRAAGRKPTCRTTWLVDASTPQATRVSSEPISPHAWNAFASYGRLMSNPRTIEAAEMQQLVETLGAFGEQPGGGIIRHVYDDAWTAARQQLISWMREAGLEVREDTVGNVFGRINGDSDRTILTGSHIDTVVLGGRCDGAMGVLSALAALRVLKHEGRPRKSLEMVALCEEEDSRFHCNFWGTRGILGLIQDHELDDLRDLDGITIREAMRRAGFSPDRFREAI